MAERCLVCDTADPLGLAVCPACGGTRAPVADRLLFVLPGPRRGRRTVRERLGLIAGRSPRAEAVEATMLGLRALARVPGASAEVVAQRLLGEGLAVQAVAPGRAWAAMPLSFGLLLLAATGAGLFAGLRGTAALLVLTPIFAATLVWSAIRGIKRPLYGLEGHGPKPPLPPSLLGALAELPAGQARDLLVDLARAARDVLAEPNPAGPVPQLHALLPVAVDAARDLDGLDRTLADFEARARGLDELPAAFRRGMAELQATRGRLVTYLLDVTGLVGRLQSASADALDSAGARLAETAGELRAAVQRYAEALEVTSLA